ncbi:MAG TPA: enoyl-CoA hydratase/isomerase family protein [Acidimicrobiales bacterium]|nr:enoyl-CoA hydratase/isomerase family protein [Acidimicrobiales bacterium]
MEARTRKRRCGEGGFLVDNFETILYEERDGFAVVTLNRPEVLNSFNRAMQEELRGLWTSLRTNDDVRAVVLTGAGEKAFCSGIDRTESIEEGYLGGRRDGRPRSGSVSTPYMYNDPGSNLNPKQNDFWKPVVAAVNGMACGGALYMLGESDIIIAAEHATFFDPHVSYGMVAGFESMHLLQKLPLGETLRVMLLGGNERMSAARAYQLGLVSEVVPADQLLDKAMWVAGAIAAAPALAVQGTLRAVWMAQELSRREALSQVSSLVSLGTKYENIEEGQRAFKEARPEWRLR